MTLPERTLHAAIMKATLKPLHADDGAFKFAVGEKVQSAPDSSDITFMKATWIATIRAIRSANDSGGCYETCGEWVPIKNDDGTVSDSWSDHDPSAPLTLRQLWGSDLIRRD
jgi:hypothetical protein